ncbi:MAG: OpgC domain-containing protein, partial [Bradyrhizobium sp.]
EFLESLIPRWMIKLIYPIDKSNLDMLRFTHFLALALVVVRFVPKNWPPLTSRWLLPLMACGRHSLSIFCLGIFLSFSAHWILTQYSKGFAEQLLVSMAGIGIMVTAARLLDWYKTVPVLFEVPTAEPAEA